jgi:hypothetical protein
LRFASSIGLMKSGLSVAPSMRCRTFQSHYTV